ncbi:MAG: hypothetical protein GIX03_09610 [Candidatus Eremiobacteraeota bacterium]|nr:hypothetical protein [Candidatus Eremiobacteraeota bacterium]MBC5803226.1 hypothetical protein [Candidatus Eremiobacteraeota bacterium]MBC5823008.1 hypothetical protein [Candidatus Eremiobacteraeota bacterium]
MRHLRPDALRRALDEPQALLASQRRHLDGCVACRRRSGAPAAQAAAAQAALAGSTGTAHGSTRYITPARGAGRPVAFWSACAAAAIVLLFVASPLRTLAQGFLAIFEPRQFVALPISRADAERLRTLPDLSAYGVTRDVAPQRRAEAADARQAALLARMPVRVPSFVPPGTGLPAYHLRSRTTTAFTFSAAKAAAAAAAAGRSLPPMPRGLDGSTLAATVGPIVMAIYEAAGEPARERRYGRSHDGWPKLLVAQMPAPTMTSNGVSAATLIDYVAAQPGLPPQVAAELRAISDPTSTLPIPVPIERMRAEHVVVQGAPGLMVGDNTGVGGGVIWQSRGYVYGVAGTLPGRTILAVANSLH